MAQLYSWPMGDDKEGVLWSPSYFASSCGGAPISIVRQYIEQQQTPH
jgi:putative transposase